MSDIEAKTEVFPPVAPAAAASVLPAASAPTETPTSAQEYRPCDECGVPLDHTQRYCVNCGAHRRDANDPAARYLGEASARARRASSAPVVASSGVRRSPPEWLTAIAIALVPIAAAVGVAIGRSSNSQDAALIRAIDKQHAAVLTASGPTGSTTHASKGTKSSKTSKGSHRGSTPKSTNTKFGKTNQITGSGVSKSEAQKGAAEAKKEQNASGQGYVKGENNLGTTVIP
jgi:hypothetical protein